MLSRRVLLLALFAFVAVLAAHDESSTESSSMTSNSESDDEHERSSLELDDFLNLPDADWIGPNTKACAAMGGNCYTVDEHTEHFVGPALPGKKLCMKSKQCRMLVPGDEPAVDAAERKLAAAEQAGAAEAAAAAGNTAEMIADMSVQFSAAQDAKDLCDAMYDWGTKEVTLLAIIMDPRRSFEHLQKVKKHFKSTRCVRKSWRHKTLESWIKSETSCELEDKLIGAINDRKVKAAQTQESREEQMARSMPAPVKKEQTTGPALPKPTLGLFLAKCGKGLVEGAKFSITGWYDLAKMVGKGLKFLVTNHPANTARLAVCAVGKYGSKAIKWVSKKVVKYFIETGKACNLAGGGKLGRCLWQLAKAHPLVAAGIMIKKAVTTIWNLFARVLKEHWNPLPAADKVRLTCAAASFITLEFVIYPMFVFKAALKLVKWVASGFARIVGKAKAAVAATKFGKYVSKQKAAVAAVTKPGRKAASSALGKALGRGGYVWKALGAPFKAYINMWSKLGKAAQKALSRSIAKVSGRTAKLAKTDKMLVATRRAMSQKGLSTKKMMYYQTLERQLMTTRTALAKPGAVEFYVSRTARYLLDPVAAWRLFKTLSSKAVKASKSYVNDVLYPLRKWQSTRQLSKAQKLAQQRAVIEKSLKSTEKALCDLKAAAMQARTNKQYLSAAKYEAQLLTARAQQMRYYLHSRRVDVAGQKLYKSVQKTQHKMITSKKHVATAAHTEKYKQIHRALAKLVTDEKVAAKMVKAAGVTVTQKTKAYEAARRLAQKKPHSTKLKAHAAVAKADLEAAKTFQRTTRRLRTNSARRAKKYQSRCGTPMMSAFKAVFKRSGIPRFEQFAKRSCAGFGDVDDVAVQSLSKSKSERVVADLAFGDDFKLRNIAGREIQLRRAVDGPYKGQYFLIDKNGKIVKVGGHQWGEAGLVKYLAKNMDEWKTFGRTYDGKRIRFDYPANILDDAGKPPKGAKKTWVFDDTAREVPESSLLPDLTASAGKLESAPRKTMSSSYRSSAKRMSYQAAGVTDDMHWIQSPQKALRGASKTEKIPPQIREVWEKHAKKLMEAEAKAIREARKGLVAPTDEIANAQAMIVFEARRDVYKAVRALQDDALKAADDAGLSWRPKVMSEEQWFGRQFNMDKFDMRTAFGSNYDEMLAAAQKTLKDDVFAKHLQKMRSSSATDDMFKTKQSSLIKTATFATDDTYKVFNPKTGEISEQIWRLADVGTGKRASWKYVRMDKSGNPYKYADDVAESLREPLVRTKKEFGELLVKDMPDYKTFGYTTDGKKLVKRGKGERWHTMDGEYVQMDEVTPGIQDLVDAMKRGDDPHALISSRSRSSLSYSYTNKAFESADKMKRSSMFLVDRTLSPGKLFGVAEDSAKLNGMPSQVFQAYNPQVTKMQAKIIKTVRQMESASTASTKKALAVIAADQQRSLAKLVAKMRLEANLNPLKADEWWKVYEGFISGYFRESYVLQALQPDDAAKALSEAMNVLKNSPEMNALLKVSAL